MWEKMLNKLFKDHYLGTFFRLPLSLTLVTSGYLKMRNIPEAKMAVRAYQILPISLANILGNVLPWIELGIGVLLLLGVATKYISIFAFGFMLIFIIAISQAWVRGLSISCGCFGGGGVVPKGRASYLPEILRDSYFALSAIYLFLFPVTKFSIDNKGERKS